MDYARKSKEVARDLVGTVLDVKGKKAEIVETEAFEDGNQTLRRECMKFAPGQIGIMKFRGSNFVNIATGDAGEPSCVLIRAVRIEDVLYDGPGKVGKALDAEDIEYLVLGKNIPVSGRTKDSTYHLPRERADNSKGRYRIK